MKRISLAQAPNCSTGRSGFTLVELAVVTLLIALFAGVTVPLLDLGGERALRATGRRIAGMTRWCYNEAALTGLEHQLVFDLEQQVFFSRRREADGQMVVLAGAGRQRTPVGQVRIKDLTVVDRGLYSNRTVAVRILPGGWLEETVIHLEEPGETQLTVRLMPLTGIAETYDGYREL